MEFEKSRFETAVLSCQYTFTTVKLVYCDEIQRIMVKSLNHRDTYIYVYMLWHSNANTPIEKKKKKFTNQQQHHITMKCHIVRHSQRDIVMPTDDR